jgi:chromosome segregation ATPase
MPSSVKEAITKVGNVANLEKQLEKANVKVATLDQELTRMRITRDEPAASMPDQHEQLAKQGIQLTDARSYVASLQIDLADHQEQHTTAKQTITDLQDVAPHVNQAFFW